MGLQTLTRFLSQGMPYGEKTGMDSGTFCLADTYAPDDDEKVYFEASTTILMSKSHPGHAYISCIAGIEHRQVDALFLKRLLKEQAKDP